MKLEVTICINLILSKVIIPLPVINEGPHEIPTKPGPGSSQKLDANLFISTHHPTPFLFACLLLSGDIKLNPGPNKFTVCTVNVQPLEGYSL